MEERLTLLNSQLQQKTVRNRQLGEYSSLENLGYIAITASVDITLIFFLTDNEAFGLRREVRMLKLQLAACSATASAVAGCKLLIVNHTLHTVYDTCSYDALEQHKPVFNCIFNSLTAYQTQLQSKMEQLLQRLDGDTFLSKFTGLGVRLFIFCLLLGNTIPVGFFNHMISV